MTRALLPPFAMLALANGLGTPANLLRALPGRERRGLRLRLDTGVFRLERVRGLPRAVAAFGLGCSATVFTALVPWLLLREVPLRAPRPGGSR